LKIGQHLTKLGAWGSNLSSAPLNAFSVSYQKQSRCSILYFRISPTSPEQYW